MNKSNNNVFYLLYYKFDNEVNYSDYLTQFQ